MVSPPQPYGCGSFWGHSTVPATVLAETPVTGAAPTS